MHIGHRASVNSRLSQVNMNLDARHLPLVLIAAPIICCFHCDHTWLCLVVATMIALVGYVVTAIVGELRSLGCVRGGTNNGKFDG